MCQIENLSLIIIEHFSRSHGMLIEKLVPYDISTGVLWWLEYFLYADQFLLHYTIILLEITCWGEPKRAPHKWCIESKLLHSDGTAYICRTYITLIVSAMYIILIVSATACSYFSVI